MFSWEDTADLARPLASVMPSVSPRLKEKAQFVMIDSHQADTVAFVWQHEHHLLGHIPPLVDLLTNYARSALLPEQHLFEKQMKDCMNEEGIVDSRGVFLSTAYDWLKTRAEASR